MINLHEHINSTLTICATSRKNGTNANGKGMEKKKRRRRSLCL
jgi:hypothetical protein